MKPNYFETKRMRRHFFPLFVCSIGIAAFCFTVSAGPKSIELPPENAPLKPGPGMAEASMCTTCHSADYIAIQPRFTRTVWKAEVTKMQQKYGAPIPTNMVDRIVEYLTVNYGQENPTTNAAPAQK